MATTTVGVAPGGSLGLKVSGDLAAHDWILKGFPFVALKRFSQVSGYPVEQVAAVIRVSPRALARRKAAGRLRTDESERLFRVARLFDLATALFEGNRQRAAEWLASPQKALGGETPLGMAQTEVGAREVTNLIGRLEYGVFT